LDVLVPDVLPIEIPQEVDALLVHAAHAATKPPVALLIHRKDSPDKALPAQPDPFEWFAKVDSYCDGERWWNDRVEERRELGDFLKRSVRR